MGKPPAAGERRLRQRGLESRRAILIAALAEFADKGFEGASLRAVGTRAGVHYTLITYHFRTKQALWEAVAEHFFAEISARWDEATVDPAMTPLDRIRAEYRAFLRFIIEYPDFHQFMMRENRQGSPRLPWLMETFLAPVLHRLTPQIEAAQAAGDLPPARPVLMHYLVIGMTSVLSMLGAEIRYNTGVRPDDPEIVEEYWRLIDRLVFKR